MCLPDSDAHQRQSGSFDSRCGVSRPFCLFPEYSYCWSLFLTEVLMFDALEKSSRSLMRLHEVEGLRQNGLLSHGLGLDAPTQKPGRTLCRAGLTPFMPVSLFCAYSSFWLRNLSSWSEPATSDKPDQPVIPFL